MQLLMMTILSRMKTHIQHLTGKLLQSILDIYSQSSSLPTDISK